MKKILVMALAAVSALAVNAKDYTVYSNGALSEGVNANYWWNLTQNTQAADPAGSEAKTWSLTFADFPTGANFCGGLAVPAGTEVAGPLATATLTFKYYATTPCKITVQLGADGVNSTQVINVAEADAKVWKEATYSMATDFSAAAEKFAAYAADGAADLLGLIVENFSSTEGSETVLYINDVVFKNIDESWVKPEVEKPFCPVANVPAVKAEDVVSLYSSFGIAPHNVGGWGQSTVAKDLQDDNNNPVYRLSNYNYLGWELNPRLDISDMEYLHIEVYPTTQTTIGVTPISPGKEKPTQLLNLKANEWNVFDLPVSTWVNSEVGVVANDVFQFKFDSAYPNATTGGEFYAANVYFWKDTRVLPVISAEVADITSTGAKINWTVTMPAEIDPGSLDVLLDETVIATNKRSGTCELNELQPATEYTYTMRASVYYDGDSYESDPLKVTFKTLRDASTTISYHQIVNGLMEGVHLVGETAEMNRNIPVSMMTELIYNADNTVTVEFSIKSAGQIDGFVPEVNIGNNWSGSLLGKDVEGVYTWTTPADKPFEEGANLHSYFWFAYPGGVKGIDMKDFALGTSNEPVAYGELADVKISAKATDLVAGAKMPVVAYAVDAQGNYLLDENVALSIESEAATLDGICVVFNKKGSATVTATVGDFSADLDFTCAVAGTNVAKGLGVIADDATEPNMNATDENEGTLIEFSCAETQEHTIALDLTANHDIEAVELVWEGACAKDYTITIEREEAEAPAARVKAESKVVSEAGVTGGGGMTIRKTYSFDTPVVGRYVTLKTSAAFEPAWGIKLKELRVLGSRINEPSGIEAVEAESDAPARFFRLDGVEVSADRLTSGVYVKLQGSKASKVFVR